MKGFVQISDEILNKIYKLTVFNGIIYNYYFFILFDENGIFCISQSGWKRRNMAAEICSARAGLYKS
jgi:hypothetical protein